MSLGWSWARKLQSDWKVERKTGRDHRHLPATGLERDRYHEPRQAADGGVEERFPKDLDYTISLDTTLAVTEGIKEIVKTLFEAIALVIFVVYIFLQGWRATLIPLLAVPVSLVGTFALFPLLGFSINTLSLFGLVLAIGLVVDDAIVVVEAVEHHIEQGMSPRDASSQGHGTSLRARGGDRNHSRRRFHSDGVYPGNHRPLISTVRRDNRGVGHDLCFQRAFLEPRAVRAAAETTQRVSRSARSVLPLV